MPEINAFPVILQNNLDSFQGQGLALVSVLINFSIFMILIATLYASNAIIVALIVSLKMLFRVRAVILLTF